MKQALQFSGGRDSLALLLHMQPLWDDLTVYWCNTGAAYPETLELMEKVKALVPHFVEIAGDRSDTRFPADFIPYKALPFHALVSGTEAMPVVDRYSCCLKRIMQPLHARMLADGVTVLYRGQRNQDVLKSPIKDGFVEGALTIRFPLKDWLTSQVDAYLADELPKYGLEMPRFYSEGLSTTPDCMDCTAWIETGAIKYLIKWHPQEYRKIAPRLNTLRDELFSLMGE